MGSFDCDDIRDDAAANPTKRLSHPAHHPHCHNPPLIFLPLLSPIPPKGATVARWPALTALLARWFAEAIVRADYRVAEDCVIVSAYLADPNGCPAEGFQTLLDELEAAELSRLEHPPTEVRHWTPVRGSVADLRDLVYAFGESHDDDCRERAPRYAAAAPGVRATATQPQAKYAT
jgi:hypothetical protein